MSCCGRSIRSAFLTPKKQTTREEIDARTPALTDVVFARAPITLNVPAEQTLQVNESNIVENAE